MSETKTASDWSVLKRVVSAAAKYPGLFGFTIFLALVVAPVSVLRPKLVSIIVDENIMNNDLEGLYFNAFLFLGVVLLAVLLRYLFTYFTALIGQNVVRDIRTQVFNKITSLKLRYFDQVPIGKSTTRTINDVETINSIFTQGLVTMLADILGIVAAIFFMFTTSVPLTLVILCVLPILLIGTYIFKEKVKKASQKVRKEISNMNAFLQERISGMRVIQIFGAEKEEMEIFKGINRKYTQANLDTILYYAIFFPFVEIVNYLALAFVVYFGSKWFLAETVTFGALVAFPSYISMLFRPVRMLADKFNTLQMGLIAAERVYDVLDKTETIDNLGELVPNKFEGEIEFKNVSFSYDDENEVIRDLSFKVDKGETMAIVGSTGSGKTTIISILNRFYEIQKGEIQIDKTDIKEYDIDSLRSKMSIVLQDVFLFHGTVLENITLKDDSISREKVIAASKSIGADKFIDQLPDGYDYKVMERGGNLSLGQRQLISFVRALVFDPDILILDEATSSIDTETEAIIQYAIEQLIAKRTSIIIAHRLTTIKHADNILVMKDGQKVEFGSHDELLENEEGDYRNLYDMQFNQESELAVI